MNTTRKTRPEYLTRGEAETLIADAIGAERERSERAMAAVMLALGGAAQALDRLGDAVVEAGRTLDLHSSLIGPMAEAYAAGMDMTEASGAAPAVPN